MLANRGDCCCYSTTKIRIWCRAGRPWTLSRRLCRWRLWWCSVVDNQLQGCSPTGTKNLPGSSFPVSRSRGPPNTWPENIENYQSLETAKDIKCLRAQLSSCVILLRDRLTDSSLAWLREGGSNDTGTCGSEANWRQHDTRSLDHSRGVRIFRELRARINISQIVWSLRSTGKIVKILRRCWDDRTTMNREGKKIFCSAHTANCIAST